MSSKPLAPSRAVSPPPVPSSAPYATSCAPPVVHLKPAVKPADPRLEPAFDRFKAWTQGYVNALASSDRLALDKQGVRLAQQRRNDMVDLIQSDPARALELSVPASVRQNLPPSVLALLEERVAGRGDLAVLAALAEPGRENEVKPVFRLARINGKTYHAFVYGRRLGEPTHKNIPMHGIALDGLLAVDENPVRQLEPGEAAKFKTAAPYPLCAVCGRAPSAPDEKTLVEVAGEPVFLCSPGHAETLNDQLIAAETYPSPGDFSTSSVQIESAWTEGTKKLILIRVDFSDLPGIPFSDSTGVSLISGLNAFYRECSYGRTSFTLKGAGSDITPTFRMPHSAAYYGANDLFEQLRTDARAAATAAGFKLGNYHFDIICFGNVPGWSWAGLGYIGAAGVWLHASFDTGTAAHELGHNFGLMHANFWDTGGDSVIGPGTSIEYGDPFDTMGMAMAGQRHFNARYKNYLNWLTASSVRTFTTNGVYQIYPHDLTNSTGVRALKISRNASTNYWVEFRQKFTGNKWLMNGVGLRWAQLGNQSSLLLDTTPGSLDGKDDSAIVFGRTFSDFPAGIHITPLGTAATTPISVLVMVNRGAFPTNLSPMLSLSAGGTNALPNSLVNFTATASDPNGDGLAFSWDFGDRSFGANTPVVSHRWSATGLYVVRCAASDMKGGLASDSLLIRVGSPTTRVVCGRITADGSPLAGVRVSVSSAQFTITDSDGTYKLAGLANGSYSLSARLDGYAFIHPYFTNPILLRADTASRDFIGIPSSGQALVSLIPTGAVWKYLDNGSNQGSVWTRTNFNDSLWPQGAAKLGYGDYDDVTKVRFGSDPNHKFITTYFRRPFVITNLNQLAALRLSLLRDDGAVAYLNGHEIFRSNMPTGTILYNTLASSAVGGADELTYFDAEASPNHLVAGTNLLAVEIHQSDPTSSDLGFDLSLMGVTASEAYLPTLSWEPAGDGLRFFWPAAATGWALYSTPDLAFPSAWSSVSAELPVTNGQNSCIIVPNQTRQFFSLQRR